jgi:hypothetical protein
MHLKLATGEMPRTHCSRAISRFFLASIAYRHPGSLDDYTFSINGCLCLFATVLPFKTPLYWPINILTRSDSSQPCAHLIFTIFTIFTTFTCTRLRDKYVLYNTPHSYALPSDLSSHFTLYFTLKLLPLPAPPLKIATQDFILPLAVHVLACKIAR